MSIDKYTSILVPVDGSEQAKNAFHEAVSIAKRNQARIQIVFVIDNRSISLSPELTRLSANDFASSFDTSFINDYIKIAKEEGVEADATVDSGSPSHLIATVYPKRFKADLIVIAATGKGVISRAIVGSVSSYVSVHAPCNVLIVRS